MTSQLRWPHRALRFFPHIFAMIYLCYPVTVIASPETFILNYRSAFTHYQKFIDQPTLAWQEANVTVDKIGGWRFYAKEAAQPDAVDAATARKPPPQAIESVEPSSSTTPHSNHEAKP